MFHVVFFPYMVRIVPTKEMIRAKFAKLIGVNHDSKVVVGRERLNPANIKRLALPMAVYRKKFT
jgi:hypothetical protein